MLSPAEVATRDLDGAAEAVGRLSTALGRPVRVDPPGLLAQRRALAPFTERRCRLLPTADGWLAVHLARPTDPELVPAWLRGEVSTDDPWPAIEETLLGSSATELAAWGQELGLAVAVVVPADHEDEQTRHRDQRFPMAPYLLDGAAGAVAPATDLSDVSVVDLTALWAGPLATSLLARSGSRVTKIESTNRPDGARAGSPAFFAALDRGKRHLVLDFGSAAGREELRWRCDEAEVVVTASRPRALTQLGLDPDRWRCHVAITGYGWTGPWSNRVAFGDDAGAAGGLASFHDPPRLVGDAVPDPAAGLYAAAAALAALASGFAGRIDVALREVANHLIPLGAEALEAA